MSVLVNQQLAACEERLTGYVGRGVFSKRLSSVELMDAWQRSYYYLESTDKRVPEQRALTALILLRLEDEAAMLSGGEESLLQRLLFSDGETQLLSYDEITYAEALVRRLWCTVRASKDGQSAVLRLEKPLMQPLTEAMGSEEYNKTREKLFALDATLHGLLYLAGFLYADIPVKHFLCDEMKRQDETARLMLMRSLRAAYDFCFDDQGDMLLLHPGLAEPEKLISYINRHHMPEPTVTKEMLLGGMNELLPEEKNACEQLSGALHGALRPDMDETDAVNDLKLMVKQGAPFEEMKNVMENMLTVLPTERMLYALKGLEREIVRWAGMRAAVLH